MTADWVTGARGFIGRHLARRLARAGRQVVGVGHGLWPEVQAEAWGVSTWLNGDVDAANLTQLAAITGPPARIFHLAGGSSVGTSLAAPHEDFRRTVASTAELLEWARLHAPEVRIVMASSAAVYGDGHAKPIAEAAELRPYSPYGTHKLVAEQLCKSYAEAFALRIAIVRLFSVYGEGLEKQLLWDLCSKLAKGIPPTLGGSGEELRDWVHVDDVAHLLDSCGDLASEHAPVINGGRGEGVPVRTIAELVRSAWGISDNVAFSGYRRKGDPQCLVANPDSARRLGFEWKRSPDEGIPAYVAWFKARAGGA